MGRKPERVALFPVTGLATRILKLGIGTLLLLVGEAMVTWDAGTRRI